MKRSGKTYFITGGASGLGEACVRRLCSEGANVAIADRDAGTTTFFSIFSFRDVFQCLLSPRRLRNYRGFFCFQFSRRFFFSVFATFLLFVLSRITKLSRRYFVCSLDDDED